MQENLSIFHFFNENLISILHNILEIYNFDKDFVHNDYYILVWYSVLSGIQFLSIKCSDDVPNPNYNFVLVHKMVNTVTQILHNVKFYHV